MPTFKLEEMDENQPYGGDNDMYFRQWRLPSMKPVLDEKLDRDFLDAVAKKDEMMRKRAERRQKHSEKYDRKFQGLVQKMSEASVKDLKPQDTVFRKPTDAEMRKARDELEREFASPSSTAKMVPFKGNVRPRQNPIFGEKMVSMKSLVLPSSSIPTSSKDTKDSTSNTNFGAHETVFYPQTHDSFNLDHYNGSRPSFAFSGIQGATSTPVSAKTGAFFKAGIPEEDGFGDDSVFETSKYVTAMESPIQKNQKASEGIQKALEEEKQKALEAEKKAQEDLKAKNREEQRLRDLESERIREKARQRALELEKKARKEEDEARIQKIQDEQRKVLEKEEKANSGRFGKGNPIFEKKTNAFGSIFGQKLTQMEQQKDLGAANPPGLSSIFGSKSPPTSSSTGAPVASAPSSIFSAAQNAPKPSGLTDAKEEKPLISSIFGKKLPPVDHKQESAPPSGSIFASKFPLPTSDHAAGFPASSSIFSAAQNAPSAPKPDAQTDSKKDKPLFSFGKQPPPTSSGDSTAPFNLFSAAQNAPKPPAADSKEEKPLISSIFGKQAPPTSSTSISDGKSPLQNLPKAPESPEQEQHASRPMGIGKEIPPPSQPIPQQQKPPTRPYALFKNYINLLQTLQADKKTFETTSDPQFRALLKRTITEKVTVFTERQTSAEARGEILEFFKAMLQKQPVQGFAVVGEAPTIQLEKDEEVNYAVHCLVEKYISLAELDEELAPTISDLISRLSAVVRRVEKVFIVLMFNKSTLLRQNPEECQTKFVEHAESSSDEKAIEWNQERSLVVLFFTVFAKNALISAKGRKMVLSDELLWKYVETSISEIFEVPKAAFVLLQLITTCKPRLHLDDDRWYDMLDTIDTEILPELEINPFPGDEAVISQLAQMVAHLKE